MIAITGASGRLGRSVAWALAERGRIKDVILGTREPPKIRDLAGLGFRTPAADFDRPETLEQSFRGASVVLIICGTAPNEIRIKQHRRAIDAALRAGVSHLFYTSFVNPRRDSLFPYAAAHRDTEDYLAASGIPFSVIRNNHYFDNLKDALRIARDTGELSLPGAHGKVAYLGLSDIGDAMAELLLREPTHRQTYELTGPEALDLFQVGDRADAIWGSRIRTSDMSAERYIEVLTARGLPPYAVEAQVGIRLACGANEYSQITSDLEEILSRSPKRLDDYLASIYVKPHASNG